MAEHDNPPSRGRRVSARWSSILIPITIFILVVTGHNMYTSHSAVSQYLSSAYDTHPQNHVVPQHDDPAASEGGETMTDEHQETTTTETHEPLNILLLYPDDWRHDTIGKVKPIVHTPFLNSLADRGIRFTYNCVTTSICWISRASLFTGQYASTNGSFKLFCPNFVKPSLWTNTWPAMLRATGNYFVGHVGKWQYHHDPCSRGGFDTCKMFEGRHWYEVNGKDYSGSELAKIHAIDFLRGRPKDKQFALSVAFYPPKAVGSSEEPGKQWSPDNETKAMYANKTIEEPYNHTLAFAALPRFIQSERSAARGRWRERYGTPLHYQESMKNYYALVTQVDKACGQIVDELRRQGILNKTMVIFTTDNGMFHGSHGLAGKWYPYQESIRVPLIIHDPRIPSEKIGSTDESLTLNIDLAETILGAAGIDPHPSMEGRDMSDLYLPNYKEKSTKTALETTPWRDEFFYEFDIWDNGIPASTALVRRDWKYIHWPHENYEELFDLTNDPLELRDVWDESEHADVLNETRTRHNEMRKAIQKPTTENEKNCQRNVNYHEG